MAPIRKGDGTPLEIPGVSEVRSGDGRVFFEGGIPDSVTDYWPADEGDGSVLGNNEGDTDMTMNFATWVNDTKYEGDTAPQWDGVDDVAGMEEDNPFPASPEQFTYMIWLSDVVAADTDGNARVTQGVAVSTDGEGGSGSVFNPDDGWVLILNNDNIDDIRLQVRENDSATNVVGTTTIPDPTANDIFLAVTGDGDDMRLRVYASDGKQVDESGNGSRGIVTDGHLHVGSSGAEAHHVAGVMDAIGMAVDEAMPESEITDYWESTLR